MTPSPSERIVAAATAWPGVATAPGSRGELSIRAGKREIGHLHGDHAAHFAFPKDVGRVLRAQGRVGPHPAFPEHDGWAARRIAGAGDVDDVIALLRLNYDRAVRRHGVPEVSATL
jgi:hypothetical protein